MRLVIHAEARKRIRLNYLLSGKKYRYRSLRVRPHFKLIYFVDEPRAELHVVDFWDTRRDPNQLTTKLTIND